MRAFLKLAVPSALVMVFLLTAYSASERFDADASDKASLPQGQGRIVSLSPSITETLFALGLGEKVVGVTKYCAYPHEACKKPKVGGYVDPSYEAIMALDPDVVVLLPEQDKVERNLSALGIRTIKVNNKTVGDILSSIRVLGAEYGVQDRAQELERELRERMEAVKRRTAGLSRPRVVMSVARGMGSLGIKSVYVAGRNGYFDELLGMAGGVNAYEDVRIKFPKVSREGLIAMNPDVVIDLVPSLRKRGWEEEDILGEWEELRGVKAVDDGRVYVLGKDYVTIPGPRFILLLEDIAEALHPGAGGAKGARRP